MKLWHKLRGKGKAVDGVWLTDEQQTVLVAIFNGAALRSHRNLEGEKRYLLHQDEGEKGIFGRNPNRNNHRSRRSRHISRRREHFVRRKNASKLEKVSLF